MAVWATRGLTEEPGAKMLESSLVALIAVGSGERGIEKREAARSDVSQIDLLTACEADLGSA